MEACMNENGYELTPFSDETVAGTSVCPTCSNTPIFRCCSNQSLYANI